MKLLGLFMLLLSNLSYAQRSKEYSLEADSVLDKEKAMDKNADFYKTTLKPTITELLNIKEDAKFLAKFPASKQSNESFKANITKAFNRISCMSKNGTVDISPLWAYVDDTSFKGKNLSTTLKDGKEDYSIGGLISYTKKGSSTRISNPGIEFKFLISKGKFLLQNVDVFTPKLVPECNI